MVWKSLSDIAFSDAKQLLAGCRDQIGKRDTEFDSVVSQSFKTAKWHKKKISKKWFSSRKLPNLIICFSENLKIFICVRVKQVVFFNWSLKKVVRLKQFPLCFFRFRNAWKRSTTRSTRCPLENMTNLCRFHCTLSHDYLQILKPKS